MALLLASCERKPSGGAGAAGGSSAAVSSGAAVSSSAAVPFVIGVSQSSLGEPYRVQMNADLAREAQAHPEIQLIFKDAQNDSLRQRAQVEELASQGIQLLIISP